MILKPIVSEFREIIFNAEEPSENATKTEITRYKFHREAAEKLNDIEVRFKNSLQPPKKVIKRVEGGCT